MTFFEKVMKAAIDQDITNVNQLANATGIPYNALRSCKEKNKPLSDSHKRLLARALKCSVGDINRMMSEARAEELKEQWPDKAKCSPAKTETAKNDAAKTEVTEAEPVKITEEEIIGERIPSSNEHEAVKCEAESRFDPTPELEPIPEQEPVPKASPAPTADDVADAKIEEIKAKAESLLTYHDRIKEMARESLEAEYASMLRSRMLAVAIADLADLCREFIQTPDPNKAVAFMDVAGEIMKLKEEK